MEVHTILWQREKDEMFYKALLRKLRWIVYMRDTVGLLLEAETVYRSRAHEFPPTGFLVGSALFIFYFLFFSCPIMCLYVLSFVLRCRYDFRIQTMFYSSLLPVVCRRAHVSFTLFVFVCRSTHVSFMLFVFVCRRDHVSFTLFVFVCRRNHTCLIYVFCVCL